MPENYAHKLGLGTVQFGLEYGISNQAGQTSADEVNRILEYAVNHDIHTLDTAHLYGNSEKSIGDNLPQDAQFKIITKTIPIKSDAINADDIKTIEDGFLKSLERLQQSSVYGLLLHHADDLKSNNAIALYSFLESIKKKNLVSQIGVSVYDSDQIDFILNRFDIDLIQIPMNIFDQRLIKSGHLQKLKQHGVEIHVRSAFLQGLIFMDENDLPSKIENITSQLKKFKDIIRHQNMTAIEAALAFLAQQKEIDKIICGVNNLEQFKELHQTMSHLPKIEKGLFDSCAIDDTSLINPANW